MELGHPGCRVALLVLVAAAAGCGGTSPETAGDTTELARTAVVHDTREEACRDLELRMAEGDVERSEVSLLTAESVATDEMQEISEQLFAYDDVNFTAPTQCGGSSAVAVGVESKRSSVPEEIDGVPLAVYFQPAIEPF